MGHTIRSIPLQKVYLDNTNPRHDPIDNEPEIIAHLMSKEKVRKLAEDIASNGISPLDRLGVTVHAKVSNSYVALEGNRRLCALKLLADPEKAPNEPMRKVFRALKGKMSGSINQIDVAVFDTRDDARHWMRVRHEGELEGVGVRSWKSDQITRFNRGEGSRDNPNVLAHELLEYAQHRSLLNAHDRALISQTTLTRFLSNPVFRHTIGITSNKELRTDVPQAEFDKALNKFLIDARTAGSPVHSRTSANDRKAYAQKMIREGFTPTTRGAVDVRLHPDTGKIDPLPGGKKQQRDNRSPDKRSNIIPSDFQCHIKDPVHKRIYDELKSIDALEFAFSATYLLRAFIELTTRAYLKRHKQSTKSELHILIGNAADHLQSAGVPAKELKALRIMAKERDSAYSPESLGASVHGSITPTRVELNRYWDNMAGGLRHMLDRT